MAELREMRGLTVELPTAAGECELLSAVPELPAT
jgi:hypothetical protein